MSALDTAKEIVRIGNTAGLSKDVIDLLEKKLALITEECLFYKENFSKAIAESEALKLKVSQLEKQLQDPAPRDVNGGQKIILLQLMQQDSGMTLEEIAHFTGTIPSLAHHHCDELQSLGFVEQTRFRGQHRRVEGSDWGFTLTKEGRKWVSQQ